MARGPRLTESLVGAPVAEGVLGEARAAVSAGVARGRRPPSLVSLHRASTTPFSVYLRQQARTAEKVGVRFRDQALPPEGSKESLAEAVDRLERDPEVDAVLIEHPLPPAFDFRGAVARLRPEKDVDGVGTVNLGRLLARQPVQVPAVALAAVRIAHHYGIPLEGRRVAVVGRSETVGLPIALLLLARGAGADATVTVAHSKTVDLGAALAGCGVVFSCAGHPGLLTRKVVPEGAAVVDVGLSTVPDPTKPSGVRIAGDADAADLEGWVSALSPVPGGVGPVTVACLMANAVRAWELLGGGSG